MNHKNPPKRRSRSLRGLYSSLLVLIIVCCTGGGWVAAQTAADHTPARLAQVSAIEDNGTVDSNSRSLPTRTATVPRKLRHLSHRFTAASIANRNLAQIAARFRTLRANHQTASRPVPSASVELPANFFPSPSQRRRSPLSSRQLSIFQSSTPQSQNVTSRKYQQLRYLSSRCISIQFPQAYRRVGKLSVGNTGIIHKLLSRGVMRPDWSWVYPPKADDEISDLVFVNISRIAFNYSIERSLTRVIVKSTIKARIR